MEQPILHPTDLLLYDTTLRDGLGMEGLSLSLEDKLEITRKLDLLGVHYIEGGYPGSNPKDAEFFTKAKSLDLKHAKLCAFGSTRKPGGDVKSDPAIEAVLAAETPVVTLVGKSSLSQVTNVLQTTDEENLSMIKESIAECVSAGKEVVFDAEHFFDGYLEDYNYAIRTLQSALSGGATTLTLCDTNGGNLPWQIAEIVGSVKAFVTEQGLENVRIGIHAHNDTDNAVANTLVAIRAGADHVQACLNGWGERTGNANIISVIANLKLKLKIDVVSDEQLKLLTQTAALAQELANLQTNPQQPYVGTGAFAHKAGLHAAAIVKSPGSYTHIDPTTVGNSERVLVSEISGRRSISQKLKEQGSSLELSDSDAEKVLSRIKAREAQGSAFEAAEASFEMVARRTLSTFSPAFILEDFVIVERRRPDSDRYVGAKPRSTEDTSTDIDESVFSYNDMQAEAMIKIRVDNKLTQVAADGNGPVSAMDAAVRKALTETYPGIAEVHLTDYKVRIIDSKAGADAAVRVLVESSDGKNRWRTVGASTDVIEASWLALQDAYEYWIIHNPK